MEKALKCDHLSLLKGISPKEVNKHNNRGIFSVHQLSYTFRPRKTPKRTKNPGKPRYFSLQALALRENSIYVHNLPDMQDAETKVYYDIESLPHRNFYYLIGALICSPKTTKYRYFWANENKDQEKVIIDFIQYFQEITNCRFYHYGSYDVNALKKIKGKLEEQPTLDLEKIINNSVNVLSSIYPHVYFPTYSNKLKDISKILDCNWSAHNSSGINSIVWREKWEAGQEPIYKERLIQYNQEDCKALKAICDFLVKIKQSTSKELSINEQVVVRRAPEAKHTYNNRNLFRKPEYAVGYFKKISSCAYFDYQREKVFVRSNKSFTKKNKLKKKRTRFLNQPNKFVEIECTECPRCGRTRKGIKKCHEIQKDIIDLNFSSNGVRKRVTRYSSWRYMCNKCYREFNSQRWPTGRKRYGHQLMSWCVYNNIARKQKMLQVYQGLSDLFGLRMPSECLYRFKTYMANHYKKTYEEILAEILKSPVIHIDETTVNLKSDKGYVWVMTSINLVYYFYRESREGSFLKEMLSEFSGVLISDFYTAYDSIPCKHQKCLIHLIRDINDDLLKNPFDDELKKLGENFGKLLKNIVSTIDSFGLKKKELKIHKSEALHFLDDVCEKEYSSEIASNYQKRFNKNRNDLFRFLNYDFSFTVGTIFCLLIPRKPA